MERWILFFHCRFCVGCVVVESTEAPWVRRASDLKQEVVVNHDMERKLQLNSEEILRLAKDIKLKVCCFRSARSSKSWLALWFWKAWSQFGCNVHNIYLNRQDQSLQESAVKIQLLEKRSEVVKKQVRSSIFRCSLFFRRTDWNISLNLIRLPHLLNQAEQIKTLEEDLNRSHEEEKVYKETCDSLSAQVEDLSATIDELKKSRKTEQKSEFDWFQSCKTGEEIKVFCWMHRAVMCTGQNVDACFSSFFFSPKKKKKNRHDAEEVRVRY